MEEIYFLNSIKKTIEGRDYYKISVLDLKNIQIFNFYTLCDTKSNNFISLHKKFDNVSNALVFNIKRNNKISFGIK